MKRVVAKAPGRNVPVPVFLQGDYTFWQDCKRPLWDIIFAMKTPLMQRLHRVLAVLMIYSLLVPQTWATCGGGGGGGMGGMGGGGGMSSSQTYQVPWKLIKPEETPKEGLAVYWFPTGVDELQRSSLRESRTLQLYSQQCVAMGYVDAHTTLGQKYVPDGKLPVAVLVQVSDGSVVGKVENKNGKLAVGDLEKLV